MVHSTSGNFCLISPRQTRSEFCLRWQVRARMQFTTKKYHMQSQIVSFSPSSTLRFAQQKEILHCALWKKISGVYDIISQKTLFSNTIPLWDRLLKINRVIGGSFRVTLVGFGFLSQNFGKVCYLLFCECGWSGGSTWRRWRHLNPTYCNQTCLNFLKRWWGPKSLVFNWPGQ